MFVIFYDFFPQVHETFPSETPFRPSLIHFDSVTLTRTRVLILTLVFCLNWISASSDKDIFVNGKWQE